MLGLFSEAGEIGIGMSKNWQLIRPFHVEHEARVSQTNMYCKRSHLIISRMEIMAGKPRGRYEACGVEN